MTLLSRCSTFTEPSLSSRSLPSLLAACKTVPSLEQVHAQIIRKGGEQDHFLITRFISLCTSLSPDLSYPVTVFHRVSQPNNVYLWNTLIKGYSQHARLSLSVSFFHRMRLSVNVGPDKYTFPSLVKACSNELALREGKAIHALIVKYGTDHDVFVGSSLVDLYGKCREIKCARKVFDEMYERNEVSWTAMIVGYVNAGDVVEAKKLFDEMPKRNLASWNAMITGFVRFRDLKSARKLFDEMPERNVVSFTAMIDGYAKAGDMASARFFFEQSPDRDLVSWSALISGYAQNGQPNEAVKLFIEMQSRKVKPDEFIVVSLMSACSQIGNLELAKWVDSYVSQSSLDLRRGHVLAALVDMNAKCGNMDRATMLFEEMPNRDLISFCSMIQGLSIHGRSDVAVSLFDRMINEGLTPDDVAFTVILTACSRSGLVKEGCRFFDSMIDVYSLVPSIDHYACMVDLLGRAGKLKEAYELLNSMPVEPHAAAWGALLGACKLHCDIELGEEIAARLFEIEPQNAGNYVLLSDIYAATNRWLDVSVVRNKMSERGVRKIPGCSWI
ncbi:Pentatricopeptide repeat-containing protein [Actinidia chinensis var. chinensis]|uniref:Pentatricopeptide repeat-containing protein n=1 Tax=Actinidia chinensis var. chinensis TaxID=1590841 RepID=A0A2R6PWK2_ACTCC|nr:Pentatricopeptide repeat-containing protein [Actinidia chinensis var. chinensis]